MLKVSIEEHLCREIVVEVPDGLYEEEKIKSVEEILQKYRDGEIVLDANDYNGVSLYSVKSESNEVTEWINI